MKFKTVEDIFKIAEAHCFYSERLRGAKRFEDAPLTGKAELYQAIEKAMARPGFGQNIYWSPTGGSSSQSLFYPTAIEENWLQRETLLPYLQEAQVFTSDTIALNLFGSTMMYRSAEIFNYFCEKSHATVLPVSSMCSDEMALDIALRFKANTIMANPSRLLQFARYVSGQAPSQCEFKIDHVIFGGEALPEHKMQYLRRTLGVNRFSGIFGSAESGIWAFKPANLPSNQYLYPEQLMHVEIVEPDQEGYGLMVLTNLVRCRNPLLRYDCGDRARFCREYKGKLLCLELAGRVEGSFQLGGEYYDLNDFTKMLAHKPDILLDYQLELTCENSTKLDQLSVSVVLNTTDKPEPEIASNRLFVTEVIENWIERDHNLFKLTVAFVEMSDLKRSATAQKIVRIRDKR